MRSILILGGLCCLMVSGAWAGNIKQDNPKIRAWNEFNEKLQALHEKLLSQHTVNKKTRVGGYADIPEFYLEESYYDAGSGQLLSVLQRVKEQPELIHALEVYIRDAKGRVVRDYSVSYLPGHRNSPVQTLISLHVYNGDLHGFRTFDASGTRIFERCERGDKILMNIDEDQIYAALEGNGKIMKSKLYRQCFKGLADKAGPYLTPH